MIITLKMSSSNYNSLENFSKLLIDKLHTIENIKFSVIGTINKKKYKNKFTVLKSPHVNKKAREQFEIRNYTKILNIYSYQSLLLLFVLKRIKTNTFSEVKLKLDLNYNLGQLHKHLKSNFNLNSVFLNKLNFEGNHYELNDLTKNYLKRLDVFGETIFKL
jgi:small subunit ribosomal protein S10